MTSDASTPSDSQDSQSGPNTNPLIALHELGQSFWLDNIRREWLRDGVLEQMVKTRGLRGLTSNPAIFHKAITGSTAYDEEISTLASKGAGAPRIYETLVLHDIQAAADVLRPVYDASHGVDGYVSLEVSPYLAHDTEGTIMEAVRLYADVDRPNVMIKVPGTPAGIPAIESLIADGVPINVTLLFSTAQYEAAARAYLRGLEARLDKGESLADVASVASVFLSRIDTLVDDLLSQRVIPHEHDDELPDTAIERLFGRAAIASARVTYQRFLALFSGPRWERLNQAGARVQRPLWASTSTKNALYSDTRYVEHLIGPYTVNTMPDRTADAFEDHGRVDAGTVVKNVEESREVLTALEQHGIDLDQVCQQLQDVGVTKFTRPYSKLLYALSRARLQHVSLTPTTFELEPGPTAGDIAAFTSALEGRRAIERLWDADATLWNLDAAATRVIADRLGWLSLPFAGHDLTENLEAFVAEVRDAGIEDVVVLGMGGSSLCSDVVSRIFEPRDGYPRLSIIDTTHPDVIEGKTEALDLSSTLFIVASKSGTTLETLSLYRHFHAAVVAAVGDGAGEHFVAITDPGSNLEEVAKEHGFRRVFLASHDVGGRYSALSLFGLVPMALAGLPIDDLLARGREMAEQTGSWLRVADNPASRLGIAMGVAAHQGRPLSIITSPGIGGLEDWLEQLIAESTGKQGRGLLPVVGESPDESYGDERFYAFLRLASEVDTQNETIEALRQKGAPLVTITLPDRLDIAQEFLRWELATALSGLVLRVNPFDEPDVSYAKQAAQDALDELDREGEFNVPDTVAETDGVTVQTTATWRDALELDDLPASEALQRFVDTALEQNRYLAVMAYLPMTDATQTQMRAIRTAVQERGRDADASIEPVVTLGFGPRLLHSIGQLYKGGPGHGAFIQIVDRVRGRDSLTVPGKKHDFNTLVTAQALGDFAALSVRGRPVVRLVIDDASALEAVVGAIRD